MAHPCTKCEKRDVESRGDEKKPNKDERVSSLPMRSVNVSNQQQEGNEFQTKPKRKEK